MSTRKLLIVGTLDETLMIIKGRKIQNIVAYIKQEYNYNVLSFFGCTRPDISLLLCVEATTDDKVIQATFEVEKAEAQEILDNILMQLPRSFRNAENSEDDNDISDSDEKNEKEEYENEEEYNTEEKQEIIAPFSDFIESNVLVSSEETKDYAVKEAKDEIEGEKEAKDEPEGEKEAKDEPEGEKEELKSDIKEINSEEVKSE